MSKKKKPHEFAINRTQYDKIRKMDHVQMDQYLKGLTGSIEKKSYDAGFEAGRKMAENLIRDLQQNSMDLEEYLERVSHISGVGPKLMERIRKAFENEA